MADLPSRLADLTPAPDNPRTIGKRNRAGLSRSIQDFGDLSGITFNSRTGHLVTGHQRRSVLLELDGEARIEWDDSPVATTLGSEHSGWLTMPDGTQWRVRVVDWDVETEHAANLAANNQAIGGQWQYEKARSILANLERKRPQQFRELRLTELIKRVISTAKGGPEDTAEADPQPWDRLVSRGGDSWACGGHTVMVGDSQDGIVGSIGDVSAVLTDPPYGKGVIQPRAYSALIPPHFGSGGRRYLPVQGDDAAPDVAWLVAMAPKVTIWGGQFFADQLPPAPSWLVWDKARAEGGSNDFADCELAWSNHGGPVRIHRQVSQAAQRGDGYRVHPTQKPLALVRWNLRLLDLPLAALVLDPYAGSGTTLIACEEMGLRCCAVEIEPYYCDEIVRRWQLATGEKATRHDGTPFDECPTYEREVPNESSSVDSDDDGRPGNAGVDPAD